MPSKFDTNQWIRSWSDKEGMTPLPERSKPKESASDPNEQNWFTRAMMTSMIAENPSVAAANGYRIKHNGDVVQEDTTESRQLAKNLAALGGATAGALGFGTGAAATGLKTAWNIINNPFVSAGVDVTTGNYGDAAVGLATDLIPGKKVADVVKKVLPTDFINVSKLDNIFPFSRNKRSTIAPSESFDYRGGTSRSQRELDVARDAYLYALQKGDRQLIGETADNYNRATSKFKTQTGLASRTDEDIVEEFNALRGLAAHQRSIGGDYLGPTRRGLKLVPELNRRGITSNYYPTIDDFTYTQVTDYDRLRYEAEKYGAKAMKAAANNDLREYNRNIELSHNLRQKADDNFGGIHRAQGIGSRTYSGINLPKTIDKKRPLTSKVSIHDKQLGYDDVYSVFNDLDFDIKQNNNVFRLNGGYIRFNVIPTKHGLKIDYLDTDPDVRKSDGIINKFKDIADSARSNNIPIYFSNRYTTSYKNGIKYQNGLQFLGKLMDRGIAGAGDLKDELYDLGTHFYLRKNGGKLKIKQAE